MIVLSSLLMIAVYFVPIWMIQLWAPQYPEGLVMRIWHNTFTGDVKVINGLNHYIGMRQIQVEMFPEFHYIGILLGLLVVIGLATALINRYGAVIFYALVLILGDIAAMFDFYRWGYDYGHHLDPEAAIIIPGMAYQPPLIGYKKLLNFEAWSVPDTGGWIIVAVDAIVLGVLFYEWWRRRKANATQTAGWATGIALVGMMQLFWGCSAEAQPLQYGKDNCDFCKMTLMDNHFGAEVVSRKGKVYKFDDTGCMVHFLQGNTLPSDQRAQILVVDYSRPGTLIDATKAFYVGSEELHSPMNANKAAFEQKSALDIANSNLKGTAMTWEEIVSGK